jgi:ubiquinone/menaquinone biosynthesis C-methylase UbiE
MESTKKINSAQEEWYKNGELELIETYLELYKDVINEMSKRKSVTILDVGGGAGYFVKEIESRIPKDVKLEIYLLDTNVYDTWNDENERIHYIEGDAVNIDKLFGAKTFDYVFCNMIFHHLLGNSFKSSREIREKVLSSIYTVLKDDGHIGIIDNYNDGYIIDGISCRIIYGMTTVTNPVIVKLCKIMGSNSAGVGVCMMSRKMWNRLIESCNFKIVRENIAPPDKFRLLKKICLLNKRYSEFNLMVLEKKF